MLKKTKGILLSVLIILELLLLVVMWSPAHVDRQDLARAVADYSKNPTPDTKAVLDLERKKTDRVEFFIGLLVVSVLVANSAGILVVWRDIRAKA
jgi:hypothetical protein